MALNDYVTICSNLNCNMQYFYPPGTTNKKEICGKCNSKLIHTNITAEEMFLIKRTSKDREFINAMIELKKNNIIEYQTRISQFRSQAKADGCYNKPKPKVCCPRCGNTEFTPLRKKFSLLTGFATNKTELICNKCGARVK